MQKNMEAVQTTRQQKIARQIQRDIAEILQKECRGIGAGTMITVTTVRVSPDFAYAKIYFSIFPFDRNAAVMAEPMPLRVKCFGVLSEWPAQAGGR